MCNVRCLSFGERVLDASHITGKDVLEVGSRDVNGSLRAWITASAPARYVGVDLVPGPGVDELCDAVDVAARFGPESFDLVVSTEALEHIRDWRRAIRAWEEVLRPGGLLLITTRSRGFGYHAYPSDWWRFELQDMEQIFSDMELLQLESDPGRPGVFVLAERPEEFQARDLEDIALYSIVAQRRCLRLRRRDLLWFAVRFAPLKAVAQALPVGPRDWIKQQLPARLRAWH